MVQGRWFPIGSGIEQPLSIRRVVFDRGRDALDQMAQQVVVYRENKAVGSARLWWQDGAFRLGEVGVLPEERHKGYGDLLVRLLLFKALTHNAARITLFTPPETEAFFAQYGFQADDRREQGTEMSIAGDAVRLSHCGGQCEHCDHPSEECAPKALRGQG